MKASTAIAGIIVVLVIIAVGYYALTGTSTTAPATTTIPLGSTVNSTTQYTTTIANTSTPTTTTNTVTNTTTQSTTTVNATTTINSTKNDTVMVASSATYGNYLTTSKGYTLYYYTSDKQNSGNSMCYGSCASNWPPFNVTALVVPSSLNASNFNTIKRTTGASQLTYNGYPLYTFVGDSNQGQISGNGVSGFEVAKTSQLK